MLGQSITGVAEQIYVSTSALSAHPLSTIVEIAKSRRWSLEFSSGIPYQPGVCETFLNAPIPRLPHNYFPPSKIPFVLNLASINEVVLRRSLDHCRHGIELAAQVGAPFYSVHAGFCVDPDPRELGRRLKTRMASPRSIYWNRFLESLTYLTEAAEKHKVDLLIENNVLTQANFAGYSENPLLCTDAGDIVAMIEAVPHFRLKILLDTGHWKVSARTLGFNLDDWKTFLPRIGAFHHSDNDGVADSNSLLPSDYWIKEELGSIPRLVHILELHRCSEQVIQSQIQQMRSWLDQST